MTLPLGCRLPDGMIDLDEYIKTHATFYEIPWEVIAKMNRDYELKCIEFNAEDNESWAAAANLIADI